MNMFSNAFNSGNLEDILFNAHAGIQPLKIRRDFLIEDGIKHMIDNPNFNVRNPLRVEFVGELGEDDGGIAKEYMMVVVKELFYNRGMFYTCPSNKLWFVFDKVYKEDLITYKFGGLIVGMAIYNGVLLELPFVQALFKRILGYEVDIRDLRDYDEKLAQGVEAILMDN